MQGKATLFSISFLLLIWYCSQSVLFHSVPPAYASYVPMGPVHVAAKPAAAPMDKKSMLTEQQRASIEKEKCVFIVLT